MSDSKFSDTLLRLTVTGPSIISVATARSSLDPASTPEMDSSWGFEVTAKESLTRLTKPEDNHAFQLVTEGPVLGRYDFWHNAQFDFYFGRIYESTKFYLRDNQELMIRFDWADAHGVDGIEHTVTASGVSTKTRKGGLIPAFTTEDAQRFINSIIW